ncbi:MAG: hypothetical protein AB7J32_22865 [Pseudonocardia sp.]
MTCAPPDRPLRLAPTHRFYADQAGRWRLAGPHDAVERVDVPPAVGAGLHRVLHDAVPPARVAATLDDPAPLHAALHALLGRGIVVDAVRAPVGGTVTVLGHGSIPTHLAAVLDAAGARLHLLPGGPQDLPAAPGDVLVACTSQLPDRLWCALDRRCTDTGLAWHRCHHEPGVWAIGPFTVPGTPATVTYRDTRARRLAAARLPDELLAQWRHLDTRPAGTGPDPDPATAAVVAGLLAADVLAHLAGATPPADGQQVLVHTDLSVTRHRVLALPADRGREPR